MEYRYRSGRSEHPERDHDIYRRWLSLRNYRKVGEEFNLTRSRIRDICNKERNRFLDTVENNLMMIAISMSLTIERH